MTTAPTIAPGRARVQGPILSPPTVSLLTAANLITDDSFRWGGGIEYVTEGKGVAQVIAISGATKTPLTGCSSEVWFPFGIVAGFETSGFNLEAIDAQARATRQLMAHESRLIEAQLWQATGYTVIDDTQPSITKGAVEPTNFTSAVTVAKSIAAMEQGLADAGHSGSPMMFHMRPYLFDLILQEPGIVVRREGNKYYTAMDNVLVPGRGYDGRGPHSNNTLGQAVGATEWMYATAPVEVRRGPVTHLDAFDRVTNTKVVLAERAVLASFDTSAVHLALEVTT